MDSFAKCENVSSHFQIISIDTRRNKMPKSYLSRIFYAFTFEETPHKIARRGCDVNLIIGSFILERTDFSVGRSKQSPCVKV